MPNIHGTFTVTLDARVTPAQAALFRRILQDGSIVWKGWGNLEEPNGLVGRWPLVLTAYLRAYGERGLVELLNGRRSQAKAANLLLVIADAKNEVAREAAATKEA